MSKEKEKVFKNDVSNFFLLFTFAHLERNAGEAEDNNKEGESVFAAFQGKKYKKGIKNVNTHTKLNFNQI